MVGEYFANIHHQMKETREFFASDSAKDDALDETTIMVFSPWQSY